MCGHVLSSAPAAPHHSTMCLNALQGFPFCMTLEVKVDCGVFRTSIISCHLGRLLGPPKRAFFHPYSLDSQRNSFPLPLATILLVGSVEYRSTSLPINHLLLCHLALYLLSVFMILSTCLYTCNETQLPWTLYMSSLIFINCTVFLQYKRRAMLLWVCFSKEQSLKDHQLSNPGHSRKAGWLQLRQGKLAVSDLHVGGHYQGDHLAAELFMWG